MTFDPDKIYAHLRGQLPQYEEVQCEDNVYVQVRKEPEEEAPSLPTERPVKGGRPKPVPPKSPGRGKGNIAKATVSRTKSFRQALDDDDWEDIAVIAFNKLIDPKTRNGDWVKIATFLARYNLVSADAQLVCDTEAGKLDDATIDSLRKIIKKDGLPEAFNGYRPYVPVAVKEEDE